MPAERRNLYRLLFVQPEAPPEVIKASYRALMTTLRAHPDLGGDHERAAQINAAYEVLSDPERRREYDRRSRRPLRGMAAGAASAQTTHANADPAATSNMPARDIGAWLADRRCPFCGTPFSAHPKPGHRCLHCDSPLTPAPAADDQHAPGELLGRRRAERHARDLAVRVRLPGQAGDHTARLRDLSFSGLSMSTDYVVARGTALRVSTPMFDTVAQVMACRRAGPATSPGWTVHVRLLTLQLLRAPRGVYVDAKA